MAAVAEYPRTTNAFIHRIDVTAWSSQPQGLEGMQLHRKADEALQHWGERAEVLITSNDLFISNAHEVDQGDVSYVSVPPNRTFFVRTRYIDGGKGQPLPFDLGDD